jgi:hypothetical protein
MRRRLLESVVVAVLIAPVAAVLASKRQVIDSHWRDRDIAIDGDNGEWPGPLVAVEENHPLLTAAINDGQYLYVVLSTNDATVRRQILRQGLIVWFDPSGGDKKHFGVKYPVGVPLEQGASRGGYRRGGYGVGRPPSDSGAGDSTQSPSGAPEPIDRLEVYGPQKDDAHSFVTTMAPGITVKIGSVEGYAVYELKVPLEKTGAAPYAIEAKPGAVIGFGLETPKVESSHEGGGGGLGGLGGGMGGRGGGGMGGRGGGGGRGGERGGYEALKPIKMWASIKLAKSASSSQLPPPSLSH